MSTTIRMALVTNFLPLLFLLVLVPSDQKTVPLKSFQIGENVTYDCIDIYKQSALDHPLLKTHKIQMKPTVSRTEFNNHTSNDKISFKKRIGCPTGTVPILRSTKAFNTISHHFVDKYLQPLSSDSPGTHVAGVRSSNGPFYGVKANFNGHNLNVRKDQASYKQVYIGSGLNNHNQVNYISAGLMINPGFFPDARVWTFGFWKGKNGKGCYNTACSGFVQVSKTVPVVEPIDLSPGKPDWLSYSIHQDKKTGNWWLTSLNPHASNVDIGYWPKELFNILDYGANVVGVGGVVQASPSGSSPPMGNGNFPNGDQKHSSLFTNIQVLDSSYKLRTMNSFHIEKLVDSPKCYGLKIGKVPFFLCSSYGFFFNYGGPGGNFCGV